MNSPSSPFDPFVLLLLRSRVAGIRNGVPKTTGRQLEDASSLSHTQAGEMVGAGSPVDPTIAGAGFTVALGGMMCFGAAENMLLLPGCFASSECLRAAAGRRSCMLRAYS